MLHSTRTSRASELDGTMRKGERGAAAAFIQIASYLEAGLTLPDALDAAGVFSRGELARMTATLSAGGGVDEMIAVAPAWIKPDERLLMTASARQGRLAEAFRRLAERRETLGRAQMKLAGMVLYPLIVAHFAAILLPLAAQVQAMLGGGQLDLLALAFDVGLNLGLLWAVLFILFWLVRRRPSGFVSLARWVPLYGTWLKQSAVARLADALSLLVETGYPMDHAWELGGRLSGDPGLRRAATELSQVAGGGGQPGPQLSRYPVLPKEFKTFYVNGERTGTLDEQMRWVAKEFAARAQRSLGAALFLTAGLVFAGIAIAIIINIFQVYGGYLDSLTRALE